jgi:CRP-like cAMP-binding protein
MAAALLGAVVGLAGGWGADFLEPPAAALGGSSDLLRLVLAILAGFVLSQLWQGAILAPSFPRGAPLAGIGRGGFAVERVAWRIGPPPVAALLVLTGPLAAALALRSWSSAAPAILRGLAIGGELFVLGQLLPVRDGAGARLVEIVTGAKDLPRRLRLALVARFLPAGQAIAAGGSRTMAWAAIGFAIWIAAVASYLRILGTPPSGGTSLSALLWLGLIALLVVLWTLGLTVQLVVAYGDALRLRGRARLLPASPSGEALARWRGSCALLAHVPELTNLQWRWSLAPVGTPLIRYGERDRTFYWLASGATVVLGRSAEEDVVPLATLREETGVGEIAFLRDAPRSADVVVRETALVAALDADEVARLGEGPMGRFEEAVRASQALDRSALFAAVPAEVKQAWHAAGDPFRAPRGETIIQEGESGNWLALVVDGAIEVFSKGIRIDQRVPGDVFGEMAMLSGQPRAATMVVAEPVLLWRWEGSWALSELERAGIRSELERLARERQATLK